MEQKKVRFMKNLATGLVILAVLLAFFITGIRIFGLQVYGVLTGSMEPTYPTGSLIYVKRVDQSELRVNDVITFSISPNVIATHRIVELVPDENNPSIIRYRTKGDANNNVDASLVSANNIIGKVQFAVPKLGNLASYIQQPPGLYVALLVCALMIGFVFYTDSLENKLKNGGQPTAGQSGKPSALAGLVNGISQKMLGKDLIKTQTGNAPPMQQGYPQQQGYGMPDPRQMQYPRQGYGQPGNQPPMQQGYAPQNRQPVNPGYGQPGNQPPMQQGYGPQNRQPMDPGYAQPQNQPPMQQGYAPRNQPMNRGYDPQNRQPANPGYGQPQNQPPIHPGYGSQNRPPMNPGYDPRNAPMQRQTVPAQGAVPPAQPVQTSAPQYPTPGAPRYAQPGAAAPEQPVRTRRSERRQ